MDQRKDAPEFDLSARASDADDALQADLSMSTPLLDTPVEAKEEVAKPKSTKKNLDAQLFNALVSPVAPVGLTGKPAIEETVKESTEEKTVTAEPVVEDDVVSMKMIQPAVPAAIDDWEPLPPLLRMAQDEVQEEISTGFQSVSKIEAPEFEIHPKQSAEPIRMTWDPAAVDAVDVLAPTEIEPPEAPSAFMAPPVVMRKKERELAPEPDSSAIVKAPEQPTGPTGSWWTIPLMCVGIATLACAVLVPAADENRRSVHELAKIERDVTYFEQQSDVNKQFLEHVSTDPTLAERLALRQLRLTRVASRVVQMPRRDDPFSMSPYALVTIDPPTPMPAYRPLAGFISTYFLDTKGQIYLVGLGVLLTAAGVILGGGAGKPMPNVE